MVFVPGFSQTSASWSSVLAKLPLRSEVHALEIPRAATFEATVDALADQGGAGAWIGYSMGGRLALGVAVRHPATVQALVLISATAGIEDPAARAARVFDDGLRAQDVETRGVDAFLTSWLAQPMFATVPKNAPGLAERRTFSPATLAHQLRALGTGHMPSYWDALGHLTMPVLLISGTRDQKFDELNTRMAQRIPRCIHVRIPSGHAVPLEAPDAAAQAITTFLHDPPSSAAANA